MKGYLPLDIRRILEARRVIERPKPADPAVPAVEKLLVKAAERGFGVELRQAEPAPDERRAVGPNGRKLPPETETTAAVVLDPERWEHADRHPGVALATALARALEATQPAQARLLEGAA